jgi:broad specificity phosphatase PhoE
MGKFTIYFIRHENRFNSATNDCSLTSDGLYSAEFELPTKIINSLAKDGLTSQEVQVYCSPTLRTLQTIWFYCKETSTKIKVEELLHETVSNMIAHYFRRSIPIDTDYNVYQNVVNQLSSIYDMIPDYIRMNESDPLHSGFRECQVPLEMTKEYGSMSKPNFTLYLSSENRKTIPIFMRERLESIKTSLQVLESSINSDVHTYQNKSMTHPNTLINRLMRQLSALIVDVDKIIRDLIESKHRFDFLDSGKFLTVGTCISEKVEDMMQLLLREFDIQSTIDTNYESDFSIETFLRSLKFDAEHDNTECETISILAKRGEMLIDDILTKKDHQNSIYISHASPIACFITLIYEKIYGDMNDLKEIFALNSTNRLEIISELDSKIAIGKIHSLTIDTDVQTIEYYIV